MKNHLGYLGLALILVIFTCSACVGKSKKTVATAVTITEPMVELDKETVPGTVDDVWVEPMYDHIRVPAKIDPNGVYYRPSHRSLFEIRPGRYQHVEYPETKSRGGQRR